MSSRRGLLQQGYSQPALPQPNGTLAVPCRTGCQSTQAKIQGFKYWKMPPPHADVIWREKLEKKDTEKKGKNVKKGRNWKEQETLS